MPSLRSVTEYPIGVALADRDPAGLAGDVTGVEGVIGKSLAHEPTQPLGQRDRIVAKPAVAPPSRLFDALELCAFLSGQVAAELIHAHVGGAPTRRPLAALKGLIAPAVPGACRGGGGIGDP